MRYVPLRTYLDLLGELRMRCARTYTCEELQELLYDRADIVLGPGEHTLTAAAQIARHHRLISRAALRRILEFDEPDPGLPPPGSDMPWLEL